MNRKFLFLLISVFCVGCADTACIERNPEVIKSPEPPTVVAEPNKAPDLPSYHFNTLEISDVKGKNVYRGDYYVESGYQNWTITLNNISTKHSSFIVNHGKFRGNECANYPILQKNTDGKAAETQLYICNGGNDVFQTYFDGTFHFYNEKTENQQEKK